MKVIIAGSRGVYDYSILEKAIFNASMCGILDITEVLSGTARGVDKLGELYAKRKNITIKKFPANWEQYGKSAGYIRNEQMGNYADALLSVWDGKSKGSKHMIKIANDIGLVVYVYMI